MITPSPTQVLKLAFSAFQPTYSGLLFLLLLRDDLLNYEFRSTGTLENGWTNERRIWHLHDPPSSAPLLPLLFRVSFFFPHDVLSLFYYCFLPPLPSPFLPRLHSLTHPSPSLARTHSSGLHDPLSIPPALLANLCALHMIYRRHIYTFVYSFTDITIKLNAPTKP